MESVLTFYKKIFDISKKYGIILSKINKVNDTQKNGKDYKMNIKKNESKMYYKTIDIAYARENKKPIIINDSIKVYVECLEMSVTKNEKLQVRFCGDVITYNDKEDTIPSSEFKMFYSIQDFNNFVRWQRWLCE